MASNSNSAQAHSAVDAFRKWTEINASASVKAQVSEAATAQSQYCVRSFRGGNHDLGIYTGTTTLPTTATERRLSLETDNKEKCIVPLGVKFISPQIHEGALLWQSNPHTGVNFNKVPRPKTYGMSALGRSLDEPAMKAIFPVYKAFTQTADGFRVELVSISSIHADFKLIDQSSGTEVFVAANDDHCLINKDSETGAGKDGLSHLLHHSHSKGRIFTWLAD
ncbi:MAG: hypothetical protein Q9181_005068 [Wetmoreana brouardii]